MEARSRPGAGVIGLADRLVLGVDHEDAVARYRFWFYSFSRRTSSDSRRPSARKSRSSRPIRSAARIRRRPAPAARSPAEDLSVLPLRRTHFHRRGPTWNVVRLENPYIEAFVLPGRRRQTHRRHREEHEERIYLLQPRAQVPQHRDARTVDLRRHRSKFRDYRPRALHRDARSITWCARTRTAA